MALSDIPTRGETCTVIGRSHNVGLPIALLMAADMAKGKNVLWTNFKVHLCMDAFSLFALVTNTIPTFPVQYLPTRYSTVPGTYHIPT